MAPNLGWRVLGETVRGASHVRAGLPNQDAIAWRAARGHDLPLMLVVSDGHGSAKSFRSDRGSRMAVEVTVGLLTELVSGLPGQGRLSIVKRAAEEPLPKELVRRWQVAVDADLEADPFSDGELATLRDRRGERGCAAVARNPRLAYGATVLGVLVTADYLLFLQLGDGDLLTVAADGEVTRPLVRDERLIANETTSLCMDDAWREVRMRFLTKHVSYPALIVAATDGYANSFVNDAAFRQVGSDLLGLLREEGIETVKASLPGWLEEASASGSGDDISVGLVVRADALPVTASADPATLPLAPPAPEDQSDVLENDGGLSVDEELSVTGDGDDDPEARARFVARIKHEGPSEPAKRVGLQQAVADDPDATGDVAGPVPEPNAVG